LEVPKNYTQVFLIVDGEKRSWEPNGDLLFEDVTLHSAENNTPERRVILLVDIPRIYPKMWLNAVNWLLLFAGSFNSESKEIVRRANNAFDRAQLKH
jgi:aspartyl/asparaginyl beta-hydroxylase (cupin superfamily)